MTVDDRTRLNLHRKLDAVLGSDDADTLMAHLPPVTWQDVATRADVRAMQTDVQAIREDLRTAEAVIRADVRSEISQAMERQTRWMVTFNSALAVIVLTAARLLF